MSLFCCVMRIPLQYGTSYREVSSLCILSHHSASNHEFSDVLEYIPQSLHRFPPSVYPLPMCNLFHCRVQFLPLYSLSHISVFSIIHSVQMYRPLTVYTAHPTTQFPYYTIPSVLVSCPTVQQS